MASVLRGMQPENEGTATEINLFGYTIHTTEEKLEEFLTWKEEVELPLEELGAIGGEFTLCITPTSIGEVVKMKHAKGSEFDFTDYRSF